MSIKENTNFIYILSEEDYGYSKLLMATQNLEDICKVATSRFLSYDGHLDYFDYSHEGLIRVFKNELPFMDIYLLDLLAENRNVLQANPTWQELYNVVTSKVKNSIGDFKNVISKPFEVAENKTFEFENHKHSSLDKALARTNKHKQK